MAILNDATGTLMSCAWVDRKCRMGVIIGKLHVIKKIGTICMQNFIQSCTVEGREEGFALLICTILNVQFAFFFFLYFEIQAYLHIFYHVLLSVPIIKFVCLAFSPFSLCMFLRYLQDVKISVMAILNDTTGTLMSCAWKNHNCKIGLIVGRFLFEF